jgi:aminoglycoside phosphotransferase (APT) family kinase protein
MANPERKARVLYIRHGLCNCLQMAGVSLAQRDLAETEKRLGQWFQRKLWRPAEVSGLAVANKSGGFSSESLSVTVINPEGQREYVIRIPPTGGGLFPEYDLEGQARTQRLLFTHGIATPSPTYYEPDTNWIGAKFLVMPKIDGHIPADMTYARKGWLHDAGPQVQRRAHEAFLSTLVGLQRIPAAEAPWLARPTGIGNEAEVQWWREYVQWGTDNQVPDLMADAFDWLQRNLPEHPAEPTVCWGDARMSNAIFDDTGAIVGVLDWEQACLCPAESDIAWWLATRRQMLEVHGIDADPELPGFDSRADVVGRYEELIGRKLVALQWYEHFAMVRIGCCTLRLQALLRAMGQSEHVLLRAPMLPARTIEALRR